MGLFLVFCGLFLNIPFEVTAFLDERSIYRILAIMVFFSSEHDVKAKNSHLVLLLKMGRDLNL